MDNRTIVLFTFLLLCSSTIRPVHGNVFSSIVRFFAPHSSEQDNISNRQKRITSDEGTNAAGLERSGLTIKTSNTNNVEAIKRSVNEELQEIWARGQDDRKEIRSLPENEIDSVGKTKILEQRATLRVKDDDRKVSRKSKFENVNSREEKEMSSVKTLSSLSVPAGSDESGSGEEQEILTEAYTWPKGRYGLPKAVVGCPTTFGVRWKTGFRYHDTEDDGTENQRSDVFHLAANFSEDGISHEFCIKDDVEGEGTWPSGKYCIYKRGPVCPTGLKEGFVIWDDENTDNQNDKGGALPEGEYTEDTKIYFCCSTTGAVDSQISLPAKQPFFLFAYESIRCQRVLNMKSTSEFIKFDDEDHGNTDHEGGEYPYGIHKFQKDHMLFLCYYEPNKPVKSYETEMTTNLVEDNEDALDQESIRQSEEIMNEFMKQTGGVEDESSKRERTKTIIKTIKVPVRNKSSPIATVIGLVMGSLIIGTVIIFITKMVMHKPPPLNPKPDNPCCDHVETTWVPSSAKTITNANEVDDSDDNQSVASDISEKSSPCAPPAHDSWSDIDEDNELVEDQLLPDSELKGGLELLFLKQQRHYWNQKNCQDRHNHSH